MEGDKQVIKAGKKIQPSRKYPSLSLVGIGYIKRFLVSPDGVPSIQSIYGPGDIFPLTPMFTLLFDQEIYEGPTKYHYGAMTNVEIYSVENKTLIKQFKKDPALYKDLLAQAGRRLQSNIQQLESAGLKDTHRRVCHQLAFMGRNFGILKQEVVELQLPLGAEDIAALLNLTPKEVEKSLDRLKADGLLISEDRLSLPNLQALVVEAYS